MIFLIKKHDLMWLTINRRKKFELSIIFFFKSGFAKVFKLLEVHCTFIFYYSNYHSVISWDSFRDKNSANKID